MSKKISEHDMLITLATMAIKMNDLTGHDIIESLRELGYQHVVREARETTKKRGRPDAKRQTFTEAAAFTRGVTWACAELVRTQGRDTEAADILTTAGATHVPVLRAASVDEQDINSLRSVLRSIAKRRSLRRRELKKSTRNTKS